MIYILKFKYQNELESTRIKMNILKCRNQNESKFKVEILKETKLQVPK